jgi:hypothetical protein
MSANFRVTDAEAVVLRHALMTYRNMIASNDEHLGGDGFEAAVTDVLIDRLDAEAASIIQRQRENSEAPA